MSISKRAFLALILAATIATPSLSFSREKDRRGNNRYSDDEIAYGFQDTTKGQIFLGLSDIAASTYLFKTAFTKPQAMVLKQEMVAVATDLDIKNMELEQSKQMVTMEEAKAKVNRVTKGLKGLSSQNLSPSDFDEMKEHFIKRELKLDMDEYAQLKQDVKSKQFVSKAKKESLIKNITNELDSLKTLQQTQKSSFAKILGKNGIQVKTIRIAGGAFFALDLVNRVIVWNLLNDFPGYILDLDDAKNIAFNLFGIGDWEIGPDDGSRSREL